MTTAVASQTTISESNLYAALRSKDMWMRSCAVCKALLKKLRLIDSVRCQCGWEWHGHWNGSQRRTWL